MLKRVHINLDVSTLEKIIVNTREKLIDSIHTIGNFTTCFFGVPIIVIGEKNVNPYIKCFREYCENVVFVESEYHGKGYNYKSDICWNFFNDADSNNISKLKKCIKTINTSQAYVYSTRYVQLLTYSYNNAYLHHNSLNVDRFSLKMYIVFWNFFLSMLCNDTSDEEFSAVVDLAYLFGINENVTQDLCNGVIHILSEGKIDKNLGLKCNTFEGLLFFFPGDSLKGLAFEEEYQQTYEEECEKDLQKFIDVYGIDLFK